MFEEYKWFVVHTYSGYENKVAEDIMLRAQNAGKSEEIVETYIPVETVTEIVDGEEQETTRKLFPCYVMVKVGINRIQKENITKDKNKPDFVEDIQISNEAWYIIRNTKGVTGFVGPDGKPTPLSDDEAETMGIVVSRVSVNYDIGDLVTVRFGAYEGYTGQVDKIDLENEAVTVLIPMMGRDVPLEFALDQVENAAG